MKNKKRVMAGMLALTMVLAGCGNSGAGEETGDSSAEKAVKLKILCCMDPATDGQYKLDAIEETAKALGYEVEVERSDDDTYKTKIRVALQGNEMPDIFYTWGGTYSEVFKKADAMYPLNEAIEDSGYDFYDTYLQSEDGNVYALPINAFEAYGMFYNKEVLEQVGAEVPTTWEELLKLVDLCTENDLAAIAIGDKERWEGDLLYNSFVLLEDTEAFQKALSGERKFTEEPFLEAAKKIETLVQKGAFQNGYMQHTDSEVLELMKSDQAATYWTGPWMLPVMSEGELGEKIGYTTLPRLSDKVDPAVSSCTAATDAGMAVSANGSHKEEAAKFVVEYAKRLNDYAVAQGDVAVMNSPDAKAPENIPEINQSYARQMEQLENTQLWWFTSVDAKFGEPMRDVNQQLFAGQISAEDFVQELEKVMRE